MAIPSTLLLSPWVLLRSGRVVLLGTSAESAAFVCEEAVTGPVQFRPQFRGVSSQILIGVGSKVY